MSADIRDHIKGYDETPVWVQYGCNCDLFYEIKDNLYKDQSDFKENQIMLDSVNAAFNVRTPNFNPESVKEFTDYWSEACGDDWLKEDSCPSCNGWETDDYGKTFYVDKEGNYLGVSLCYGIGGPNIWVDTFLKKAIGTWWAQYAEKDLDPDWCLDMNDAQEHYFDFFITHGYKADWNECNCEDKDDCYFAQYVRVVDDNGEVMESTFETDAKEVTRWLLME